MIAFSRLLSCLVFMLCFELIFAQNLSISYQNPTNFYVCGNAEGSITLSNPGASGVSGVKVAVTLPSGVSYVPGSVASALESDISNLNQPVFAVADVVAGGARSFTYKMEAGCSLIADINSGKTFSNNISATFTGGSTQAVTQAYKIETALLVISGAVNPLSVSGKQGDVLTRKIVIRNTREGVIKSLTFNDIHTGGLSIELDGIPGGTNVGNLFRITIPGTAFTSVGNGNDLLENGESITLTEKITITKCASSLQTVPSTIKISWGCGPTDCQTETTKAEVEIKPDPSNQPKLSFQAQVKPAADQCGETPIAQELIITNTGLAPTKSISMILICPDTFHFGMDKTTFEYQKGGVWTPVSQVNGLEYALAPCGININHLANIQLPGLLPGESMTLKFNTIFCAPECYGKLPVITGAYSYAKDCPDAPFINGSFNFATDLKAQALDNRVIYDFGGCMAKDGTYDLNYWVKSQRQKVENGFMHIHFDLPQGLNWVADCQPELDGKLPVKTEITPGPSKNKRESVHLVYPLPFSSDSVGMKFCLKFTCVDTPACNNLDNFYIGSGVGMVVFPTPEGCNGCELTGKVMTGISTDMDTKRECLIGDCDDFTLVGDLTHCPSIKKCNCKNKPKLRLRPDLGVVFDTYRLNVGLKDDNDDRKADDNTLTNNPKIRRDRFVTGDTLRMVLRTYPEKGVHREVGFRFFMESWASDFGLDGGDPYEIGQGKQLFVNNTDNFKYLNGTLIFKIAATGQQYTCPIDKPTEQSDRHYFEIADPNLRPYKPADQITSMYDEFLFNFYEISKTGCIPDDFSVTEKDSVIFVSDYQFKFNFLPVSPAQPPLVNFRTLIGSMDAPYGWISDSTTTPLMRQFSGYRERLETPKFNLFPCADAEQVSPLLYELRIAKPNLFPFEVRQLSTITKMSHTLPIKVPVLSSTLTKMRLQDSPVFYDNVPLKIDGAGNIDMKTYTSQKLDEGWLFHCDFKLGHACRLEGSEAATTSGIIEYISKAFKDSSILAFAYPNPKAYENQSPQLKLTAKDTFIVLSGNALDLDFLIKNKTAFDGQNGWIVIEDGGILSNVQIIDKATGLPLKVVGGVYQIGDFVASGSKEFLIKATANTCDVTAVRIKYGWNCEPVSTPNDNICNTNTQIINIKPFETELELVVKKQPTTLELCKPSEYIEFEIYNANEGIAFGVLSNLKLPQGLKVVPGSAQVAYPTGANWVALPDPVAQNGILQWKPETVVKVLADNGLSSISTAPNNAMSIRFKVEAVCGFVANSQMFYGTEAVQACGALSNTLLKPGLAIQVAGLKSDYKVNADLAFSAPPGEAACGQNVRLTARLNATDAPAAGDSIYIQLPAGMSYVAGSYKAGPNAPAGPPDVKGKTLQLAMPSNLGIGVNMTFDFEVRYDDPAACDDKTIVMQARQKKTSTCPGQGNCNVYVATGESVLTLNTINPDLLLRNFEPVANGNAFTFKALLENAGLGASTGQVVKFYIDQNGNGKADNGETLVSEIKTNQTITGGATGAINGTLGSLTSDNLCKLIAVINGAENCACSDRVFPLSTKTTLRSAITSCAVVPLSFGPTAENGHSYEWAAAPGLSCTNCSVATFTPGANVLAGDAFLFILTDKSGGCTIERQYEVKYGIPEALQLPPQRICKGQSAKIEAPLGGTYQWEGPGVKNDAALSTQLVTPSTTSTYKLTVTFSGGCTNSAETTITVLGQDSTFLPTLETCKGNPKQVLDKFTDQEGTYYQKLSNQNGCDSVLVRRLVVKPTETAEGLPLCPKDTVNIFGKPTAIAGNYCKTFKTAQGCDSTHCITLKAVPGPSLAKPDSVIIEIDKSIQLNAASGFVTYTWTPSESLSCGDCPSPVANPKETTNYLLKVSDQNGCETGVNYRVVVFPPCDPERLLIPNAFTPNGDGVNDLFRVVPFEGIETVFSIQIYDRWGRKVYEQSSQKNIAWDGIVDGKPGLPDVYVWMITIDCPLSGRVLEKGAVSLLR